MHQYHRTNNDYKNSGLRRLHIKCLNQLKDQRIILEQFQNFKSPEDPDDSEHFKQLLLLALWDAYQFLGNVEVKKDLEELSWDDSN